VNPFRTTLANRGVRKDSDGLRAPAGETSVEKRTLAFNWTMDQGDVSGSHLLEWRIAGFG